VTRVRTPGTDFSSVFCTTSRPPAECTQTPVYLVNTTFSPWGQEPAIWKLTIWTWTFEIKNAWIYTSIPYVFMPWCIINFTETLSFLTLCNFPFSGWWLWRILRSGMWRRVLWDITQRRVVFLYRRFGTTYHPRLQGSGSPRRRRRRRKNLKTGPIRCPETSVMDYHSTLRSIAEECRSQLDKPRTPVLRVKLWSHAVFERGCDTNVRKQLFFRVWCQPVFPTSFLYAFLHSYFKYDIGSIYSTQRKITELFL
jgi:hypothetical protein